MPITTAECQHAHGYEITLQREAGIEAVVNNTPISAQQNCHSLLWVSGILLVWLLK